MIEGRISVLLRGRGMKRCRAEGAERFALFVGAAVLANNLMICRPADQTLRMPTKSRSIIRLGRRGGGTQGAAPHHVASCNSAWRAPIHAENDASRPGKISRTTPTLSPVHRHNWPVLAKIYAFRDRN